MSALISPGSRRTNRITKRNEYAEAGIGLYRVVDLDATESTCHRDPEGEEYRSIHMFSGQALVPARGGEARLDIGALGRG